MYSSVFQKLAEEERQAAAAQREQQAGDTASTLPAFGELDWLLRSQVAAAVHTASKTLHLVVLTVAFIL